MGTNSLEMSQLSGINHNLIKRFIFKHLDSIAKIGEVKVIRIDNETVFVLDKFQAFHITSLMWNTKKSVDLKVEMLQRLKAENNKVEEIKEEKPKRTRKKADKE